MSILYLVEMVVLKLNASAFTYTCTCKKVSTVKAGTHLQIKLDCEMSCTIGSQSACSISPIKLVAFFYPNKRKCVCVQDGNIVNIDLFCLICCVFVSGTVRG